MNRTSSVFCYYVLKVLNANGKAAGLWPSLVRGELWTLGVFWQMEIINISKYSSVLHRCSPWAICFLPQDIRQPSTSPFLPAANLQGSNIKMAIYSVTSSAVHHPCERMANRWSVLILYLCKPSASTSAEHAWLQHSLHCHSHKQFPWWCLQPVLDQKVSDHLTR